MWNVLFSLYKHINTLYFCLIMLHLSYWRCICSTFIRFLLWDQDILSSSFCKICTLWQQFWCPFVSSLHESVQRIAEAMSALWWSWVTCHDVTWTGLFPAAGDGMQIGRRAPQWVRDETRSDLHGVVFFVPLSLTSNSQVSPSGTKEQREAEKTGGGERIKDSLSPMCMYSTGNRGGGGGEICINGWTLGHFHTSGNGDCSAYRNAAISKTSLSTGCIINTTGVIHEQEQETCLSSSMLCGHFQAWNIRTWSKKVQAVVDLVTFALSNEKYM